MYVPGKLSDVERVLIDIGTGYYVEKVRAARGGRAGVWGCLPTFPGEQPPLTPRPPLSDGRRRPRLFQAENRLFNQADGEDPAGAAGETRHEAG